MAIISTSVLLGIADRAAYQYGLIKTAFDSINATGGGLYQTRVTNTDDTDVEIPLLSTYYNVDSGLTLATCIRSGCAQLLTIVTAMDTHFTRVSHTGSWDAYCTSYNKRLSDYFNQLHYLAKGQYMLANNVFSESNDAFGVIEIAAGPAVDFTDGDDYGDGSASNRASGSYFAATQLRVVPTDGAIGVNDLDLRLNVKDADNNPTTVDVTVPALTAEGASVNVGTGANKFLDVTGASIIGTSNLGDKITIYNKKERTIAM
jgi:hypothetical protein